MIDSPKHSVSVAGVVINDLGHVLVVQRRDNGHWEPPGGVLELDETVEDGVRREVLEETGIVVDVGPLTGVYKNMARGVVALVFRCTETSGSIISTEEASAVEWMSPAKATSLMTPAYAVRVADALRTTQLGVPTRAHDGTRLLNATKDAPINKHTI